MVNYPYNESDAILSKQSFDMLAQYFLLREDFKEQRSGHNIFIYDTQRMEQLPSKELMAIAPYVLTFRELVFDRGIRRGKDILRPIPDTKLFLELMKCKGITRDLFLDSMINFEFSELGDESTQFITAIAQDLLGKNSFLESERQGLWFNISQERYKKTKEKCIQTNEGRECLFELETILKFEAKPVALDYDSCGRLYVFDQSGKLHEFIDGDKSNEWQIRYGIGSFHSDIMDDIFSPIFPNISVQDSTLFLTNGPELERYDLDGLKSRRREVTRYTGNSLTLFLEKKVDMRDVWFHDVCLKDGNIFVSASLKTHVRTILQIDNNGEHHTIYTGQFPREHGASNTFQDLTLRLGFFKGGLYFPEKNGISRLTVDGAKEMLEGYKREINKQLYDIDPITKFAFGDDFLVVSGRVKDFELPMLQVFKPMYNLGSGADLVISNEMIQPNNFERKYVSIIPKQTGRMIKQLSLSAHKDNFAMSHYDFERVFVYKMVKE